MEDLYQLMQEIYEEKRTTYSKDIEFIGTMTTDTGSIQITHDIFMIKDEMPDGSIVQKYYDENKTFIAGRDKDGKLYPATPDYEDLSFLGQLRSLDKTQSISLKEFEQKLERVAKFLGMSKSEILAMSEVELSQVVATKGKENPQLTLEDEHSEEENRIKQNEEMLKNIPSREEINLNQLVDNRHSLAQILNVPADSKLIVVDSSYIANNQNTTRFSLLIQYPDGHLENAKMLKQIGGNNSDKIVYESNYDGSELEQKVIRSSYAIDSPIIQNGIINIRYGSLGYIELDYGQIDKTSNRNVLTQKLETSRDHYRTTSEVRDMFSGSHGVYNVSDRYEELETHEEDNGNNLTIEDADGNPNTSHNHEEILREIKAFDQNIADVFTDQEIEDYLQNEYDNNHNNMSFKEIIDKTKKDLSTDASNNRNHKL